MNVTGDSTDVTTYFCLRLAADGTAATGLTITDLDLQYVRSGAAPAAKVDATALAATDSAHADNKAIEIDATDQPGLYRVDWPDAAFASGVREVILTVKHTTCFIEHLRVQIDTPVNVTKVSGDSTAADTLELFAEALDQSTGQIDSGTFADDAIAAAKIATGAFTADAFAANALVAATFAADVTTELQSGLATAASLTTVEGKIDTIDGIVDAILVDTGTTLQAELDGIQADTEDIQSRLPAALVNSRMDSTVDGTGMESGAVAAIVAGIGLTLAAGTIGATGNSTTALHLDGLTFGDDELNDYLLVIRDVSNSEYHARWIEDWADTGDLATVATLPFTPQNSTDTYVILAIRQDVSGGSGLDAAGVRAAVGLASANLDTQLGTIDSEVGVIDGIVDAILVDTAEIGVAGAGLTEAGGTGDHLTALSVTLKDGAHGGTSATLRLGGSSSTPALYVTNSAGAAVQFEATSGHNHGLRLEGEGNGAGLWCLGGSGGQGAYFQGTNNHGLQCHVASGSNASGFSASTSASGTSYGIDTATMRVTTSSIGWNAAWDAEVQSEVTDAIVAHNLDHLCLTATGSADMTAEVADNTILARILANGDTSIFDPNTDGLQPIRDRGDVAWITATGFSTLDAAGVRTAVGLASANLDTQIGTLATAANLTTVDTVVDAIKLTTDKLDDTLEDDGGTYRFTTNALEQAPSGGGSLTAQQVWEYATRTLTAAVTITGDAATAGTRFLTMIENDGGVYRYTANALEESPVGSGGFTSNDRATLEAIPTLAEVWAGDVLTESYASDNAEFTPAQALYMIWSALSQASITSTTLTSKKLDGTTTAMTFTLNSATRPTSRTRSG